MKKINTTKIISIQKSNTQKDGKKNEYGLFERKVTSYILYNIDINDKEKILSMSKEELEKCLIPLSENIYTKEYLEEKDKMFLEDIVILTRVKETHNTKKAKESKEENTIFTLIYLALFILLEKNIKKIDKIIFRDKIKNKLKEIEYNYREINKEELKILKEILKIREDNLEMIKREECHHEKYIK